MRVARGRGRRCWWSSSLYDQLLFRPLVAWSRQVSRRTVSRARTSPTVLGAATVPPHAIAAALGRVWPIKRSADDRLVAARTAGRRALRRRSGNTFAQRVIDVVWLALVGGRRRSGRCGSSVDYMSATLSLGRSRRGRSLVTVYHDDARDRADGARDARLGAGRRVDRSAAEARREGSAAGAIPRRLPGQRAVSDRRRAHRALRAQPGHLAELPDHLRHAVVYPLQRDRRRRGLSQRSARGGAELPHSRLGLVAQGHAAGHLSLLRDRRAHRLGRLVECRHRRRICQMGQ